ncbi:MAG: dethiobiotin synthase [Ruminococcus sp.]|nr:dethiobiotin synthase [Ruminococcus sp.]
MSKNIFITATGTDVGKTYISGLLAKKLNDNGFNTGYYKSALSGAYYDSNDNLIVGDAQHVKDIANLKDSINEMVSYVYENAVSPHLATQIEGNPLEMDKVKYDFEKISLKHDYMLVEGSGGILCPIRYDEEHKIFLEDIIKALNLDTLLVADAGLGTINYTVLTIKYMESINIECKGIILNRWTGNQMEVDNVNMIQNITKVPVIATVPNGCTDINIDCKHLISLFS